MNNCNPNHLMIDNLGILPTSSAYNASHAAIFTSCQIGRISGIKKIIYQFMIRRHAIKLLKKDLRSFYVCYGNPYGLLALKVLTKLRRTYDFTIIAGKIIGESVPEQTDFKTVLEVAGCDKIMNPVTSEKFIQSIVFHSYAISNERGLYYHKGKIPSVLFNYLKNINTSAQ